MVTDKRLDTYTKRISLGLFSLRATFLLDSLLLCLLSVIPTSELQKVILEFWFQMFMSSNVLYRALAKLRVLRDTP
jgi:hypothetical protein